VGHAAVDRDARTVRVDVGQDALRRYPEFHPDRFREFSDDDLPAYAGSVLSGGRAWRCVGRIVAIRHTPSLFAAGLVERRHLLVGAIASGGRPRVSGDPGA
jgi:hypothetical protein